VKSAIRRRRDLLSGASLRQGVCLCGKGYLPGKLLRFHGKQDQTDLSLQLLGIPHPRTRLYYGRHRVDRIRSDFTLPFIAKTPIGSSQGNGVWLIENEQALQSYLEKHHPAYIQEYLHIDRGPSSGFDQRKGGSCLLAAFLLPGNSGTTSLRGRGFHTKTYPLECCSLPRVWPRSAALVKWG